MSNHILKSINKLFLKQSESDRPSRDVEAANIQTGNSRIETSGFESLQLPDELMQAIDDLGFTSCTDIQKEVLPHALDGEDVIGQAQTGTGKTADFLSTLITSHLSNS